MTPDIVIIPECQKTDQLIDKIKIYDAIWSGNILSKGLGILSLSEEYHLSIIEELPSFEWIVPIRVSGKEEFVLIAVWPVKQEGISYGKYVLNVLKEYQELYQNNKVIAMGDFNIDQKLKSSYQGIKGITEISDFLKSFKISSCYHHLSNENFGEELAPTYYHQRKIQQPFHIDYCFVTDSFLTTNTEFQILNNEDWRQLSDHLPLVIDTKHKIMKERIEQGG